MTNFDPDAVLAELEKLRPLVEREDTRQTVDAYNRVLRVVQAEPVVFRPAVDACAEDDARSWENILSTIAAALRKRAAA